MNYKSCLFILFIFISSFASSDIATISIQTKDGKTLNAKKIMINGDIFIIQILDNSEIRIPISSVISLVPNYNNAPNNITKSKIHNQPILQQNQSLNINNEYTIGERIQLGTIELMIMNAKWGSDQNIYLKRNSRIKNTAPIKQNELLISEAKTDNILIEIFIKNIGNNPINIDSHKPYFKLFNEKGEIFIESKPQETKKTPQEPLNPGLHIIYTIKFKVLQHHQYKLKANYNNNIIIIDLKK